MKILMVSSNGGHFWQLKMAHTCFSQDEVRMVSFPTPDVKTWVSTHRIPTYWGYYPTNRSIVNLIRNAWLARRILQEYHPDLVVTTGAGVGVPFIILGKLLLHCHTMFIEVFDRVASATLTGRMVYRFADTVVLQWESQKQFYPKGIVVGGLLWSSLQVAPTGNLSSGRSIGFK